MRWKLMVLTFVVFSVGFSVLAQRSLQLPAPQDGRPPFAEVEINAGGQGFAGLATVLNGTPIIYYDSVWIQRIGGYGTPSFRFLRAHEYAHHHLGHVVRQFTTPPTMLPLLQYTSELEADCAAVRVLRNAGDPQAIAAGFQVYQTVLQPFDDNRPGAISRTVNMQRC